MRRAARRCGTGARSWQKQKSRRERRGPGGVEKIARTNGFSSMKNLFQFHRKVFIGVVHLKPLPGAPRHRAGISDVINSAVDLTVAEERAGAAAVFIENFGHVPFTKTNVGPEPIAAMTAAGCPVRGAVALPIGFNVLRNDARAALALCAACGGDFIRVDVHSGAMLTDQGLIEGDAYHTLR